MKKKIEIKPVETPEVAPDDGCEYLQSSALNDGSHNLIKPMVTEIEKEVDTPDDVYEGKARELVISAIGKVIDVFDEAADNLKNPSFHGNDREVHIGLAGTIIQAGRESEDRNLKLLGANLELVYEDEDGNLQAFTKGIRNKTRLSVNN